MTSFGAPYVCYETVTQFSVYDFLFKMCRRSVIKFTKLITSDYPFSKHDISRRERRDFIQHMTGFLIKCCLQPRKRHWSLDLQYNILHSFQKQVFICPRIGILIIFINLFRFSRCGWQNSDGNGKPTKCNLSSIHFETFRAETAYTIRILKVLC